MVSFIGFFLFVRHFGSIGPRSSSFELTFPDTQAWYRIDKNKGAHRGQDVEAYSKGILRAGHSLPPVKLEMEGSTSDLFLVLPAILYLFKQLGRMPLKTIQVTNI